MAPIIATREVSTPGLIVTWKSTRREYLSNGQIVETARVRFWDGDERLYGPDTLRLDWNPNRRAERKEILLSNGWDVTE